MSVPALITDAWGASNFESLYFLFNNNIGNDDDNQDWQEQILCFYWMQIHFRTFAILVNYRGISISLPAQICYNMVNNAKKSII